MAKKKTHHKSQTKKNRKNTLQQSEKQAVKPNVTKIDSAESALEKIKHIPAELKKSNLENKLEILENDPNLVVRDIRQTIWTVTGILLSFSVLIIVLRQTELGSKLISWIKL